MVDLVEKQQGAAISQVEQGAEENHRSYKVFKIKPNHNFPLLFDFHI